MKHFLSIFLIFLFVVLDVGTHLHSEPRSISDAIRIMQLRRDGVSRIRYPDALPSLLELMNERSRAKFDPDPMFIESLTDKRLFENPILYVNCDELPTFEFSQEENDAIRRYMELGGFVYLDAGIKASFLGTDLGHSYAAWEEREEVREWFGKILPDKAFTPLPRNHEVFRTFYKGLPIMSIYDWNQIKSVCLILCLLLLNRRSGHWHLFIGWYQGEGAVGVRCLSYLCNGLG